MEAWRCLRTSGRIIALGPNIRYLPGAYWEFCDQHLPLTELSLDGRAWLHGGGKDSPISALHDVPGHASSDLDRASAFEAEVGTWPLFGKQFLVVARK